MRKYKILIAIIVILITVMIQGIAVCAEDREYSITKYNAKVDIFTDGTAAVEEQVTYKFLKGEFNGVYMDLDLSGTKGLTDHSVTVKKPEGFRKFPNTNTGEIDTYTYKIEGDTAKFTVYEWSGYTEKTFTYTYKLLDAITKYNDIAEFNRKIVGTSWEVPVNNVTITINLPKGAAREDIKIFSHGPLTGESRFLDNGSSEFIAPQIPKGQFYETRVLFPVDMVPLSQNIVDKNSLQEILMQEAELADQANAAREEARKEVEKLKLLRLLGIVITVLLFMLWIFIMRHVKKRFGTNPPTEFSGRYFREIPGEYPPAEVNYLFNRSDATTKDILATLLDLVRRRVLLLSTERIETKKYIMKKAKTEYVFTKNSEFTANKLKSHEEFLIHWLFKNIVTGESLRLSDIERYTNDQRNTSQFWRDFSWWKKLVRKEAVKNAFYSQSPDSGAKFAILPSLGYIAAGVIIGYYLYNYGVVISFLGLLLFFYSAKQYTHSVYGSDQYKKWNALKRFIKDFSKISDATIPSVVLWEQYLVYGITLGIAKEVIKQFPNILENENSQVLSSSYIASSINLSSSGLAGFDIGNAFSDMNTAFSSAFSIASSSSSSGSGSGGGSSGGSSGGGGGGSGGGAF